MYFSLLIIILVSGLILFLTYYYLFPEKFNIYFLYSGYSLERKKMGYKTKSPNLAYASKEKYIILPIDQLKDPRYILFRIDGGDEFILVDQEEKIVPREKEKIIVRDRITGNFYTREVKIAYTGYDRKEDYKFVLDDGQTITWDEIIGNLTYVSIK